MNESQAISRTDWRPMHALVFVALMAAASFVPVFRIWPLLWLVPFAVYGALVATVPPLRSTFRPWRFGRVSTPAILATLIIAVGSCSVLVTFHVFAHPDVSAYRSFLPVSALGGVFVIGILFSIFNALIEEVIFRGILFDSIESQWGVWMAVIVTALLFGYGHMRGYPSGPLGAVLAGVYGLCIGWLRAFTGGIGLPVIAHIAADATIFIIIARSGVL
jgi:membrane protease YdiL (CAAX protease family)